MRQFMFLKAPVHKINRNQLDCKCNFWMKDAPCMVLINLILDYDSLMLISKVSQMQGFESSVLIFVRFSADLLFFDDNFFRKII
jgi:hypothetical protein